MPEEQKLEMELIWNDTIMLELCARASNGRFAGTTEVYTTEREILDFAAKLEKFPRIISDKVFFELGEKSGYAFLNLIFSCVDSVGNTEIEVFLQDNTKHYYEITKLGEANFGIKTYPEAIRQFSQQLTKIVKNKKGIASLNL